MEKLEKILNLKIIFIFSMLEKFTEELNNFAQELIEQYKQNLERSGHNATGELANSASFEISINDNSFEINLNLADYWIYVEEGRSPGKYPPPEAILKWITVKNILPREINGKLPSEKSISYLIGRKIAQEGTRGTHDLEEAKKEIISKYENILTEALIEDYNEEASNLFLQSLFLNI